jgi:hypothetical protein
LGDSAGFYSDRELTVAPSTSHEGWIAEHGQDAVHDCPETDQDDEQLEKLGEPRIGTKLVDGPEQYGANDDDDENTYDERNHDGLLSLIYDQTKLGPARDL